MSLITLLVKLAVNFNYFLFFSPVFLFIVKFIVIFVIIVITNIIIISVIIISSSSRSSSSSNSSSSSSIFDFVCLFVCLLQLLKSLNLDLSSPGFYEASQPVEERRVDSYWIKKFNYEPKSYLLQK